MGSEFTPFANTIRCNRLVNLSIMQLLLEMLSDSNTCLGPKKLITY